MPKLNQTQINAAKEQKYDVVGAPLKALPCANGEKYVYRLVSCEAGTSQAGNSQWTWELTLDGRYHPDYVGTGYLERLWWYTLTGPGQEWAAAKMLHAFGYSPETDTDEVINDEAPVIAYVYVEKYGTPEREKMKARRFAQHFEEEIPMAKSPMQVEAEEKIAAYAAQQGVPQGPEHPASVVNPDGHYGVPQQAPAADPWATSGEPAEDDDSF